MYVIKILKKWDIYKCELFINLYGFKNYKIIWFIKLFLKFNN